MGEWRQEEMLKGIFTSAATRSHQVLGKPMLGGKDEE